MTALPLISGNYDMPLPVDYSAEGIMPPGGVTVSSLINDKERAKRKRVAERKTRQLANKQAREEKKARKAEAKEAARIKELETAMTPEGIMYRVQKAMDEANAANLERYEKGLGELESARESMRGYYGGAEEAIRNLYGDARTTTGGLYGEARDLLRNIGSSAMEDINRQAIQDWGAGEQDLISRGLGNTTIRESVRRGVSEDRARRARAVDEMRMTQLGGLAERQAGAMGGLEERYAGALSNLFGQRAGGELAATGSIADFIEGRYDTGPDLSQYAQWMAAMQGTSPGQQVAPGGTATQETKGISMGGNPLAGKTLYTQYNMPTESLMSKFKSGGMSGGSLSAASVQDMIQKAMAGAGGGGKTGGGSGKTTSDQYLSSKLHSPGTMEGKGRWTVVGPAGRGVKKWIPA